MITVHKVVAQYEYYKKHTHLFPKYLLSSLFLAWSQIFCIWWLLIVFQKISRTLDRNLSISFCFHQNNPEKHCLNDVFWRHFFNEDFFNSLYGVLSPKTVREGIPNLKKLGVWDFLHHQRNSEIHTVTCLNNLCGSDNLLFLFIFYGNRV